MAKVKEYKLTNVISSFSVKPDSSMSILLGAGASISSGIMSGGQMIWDFKRRIYCIANQVSESVFPDLSKESARKEIQTYLDATGEHPSVYSNCEYSHYFEYLFNNRDRVLYVQEKVRNATPALGYLCLGALIIEQRINLISTTNFDDLVKAGVYSLNAGYSIKTISSAIDGSLGFNLNDGFPTIIKLHGDYLVDHLKNTSAELQKLEDSISLQLQEGLKNRGLLVVGFAGNDNSVMTTLENIVENGGLPYGIIWCKTKGSSLSERATRFMESACKKNEYSGVVNIDGFDDLMYRLYLTIRKSYKEIDDRWKDVDNKKPVLFGGLKPRNVFTKTNTFESMVVPERSYVFDTTIDSWKALKMYLKDSSVIAALFKGQVWAFGNASEIKDIFKGTIKSEMILKEFPAGWFYKDHSYIWSLLYDLINVTLIRRGLVYFGRGKYYDKSAKRTEKGNDIYDAIDISLSFASGRVMLTILPTFYVARHDGKELDKFQNHNIINYQISHIYNQGVSKLINDWTKKICTGSSLCFEVDNFKLEFNRIVYTCGGEKRKETWPEIKCFQCEEPKMCFSLDDSSKIAVNQLKGLINYGPIEKNKNMGDTESIKLAVLSPDQDQDEIIQHLEKLKQHFVTTLKQEQYFLPDYIGFEKIFRKQIDIPAKNTSRYMTYNAHSVMSLDAICFYEGLTKYIDIFAKNLFAFDVLIIYIPNAFKHLRELKNESVYFDLHDSLKLYCASKGIVIQFIEGKSAVPNERNDMAKIMWGLSTGLYSKAVGRLWKPAAYSMNTAFVGLSYVQSVNNGENISIGCSQLFDAEGNGMRLYLRPLKNPQFIQKNPFM